MLSRSRSFVRKLSEEAVNVWREIQVLRDSVNSSDSTVYLIEESTMQSTLHDMRVELYCLRQVTKRDINDVDEEEEDLGFLIKKSLREALEVKNRVLNAV